MNVNNLKLLSNSLRCVFPVSFSV